MPAPDPIEDAINARAFAERKTPGVSFAPIYAFVANIAHIARVQARQVFINSLPKAREPDALGAPWATADQPEA
jgi:hypothetical protein